MRLILIAIIATILLQATPQGKEDLRAVELIKQINSAYQRTDTLSATVSVHFVSHAEDSRKNEQYTNRYVMKKPNKAYIEREIRDGHPLEIMVSDGASLWVYHPKHKEYFVRSFRVVSLDQSAFENLFLNSSNNQLDSQEKVLPAHYVGIRNVGGVACESVEFDIGSSGNKVINRYSVGPDHILRGTTQENYKAGALLNRTDMVAVQLKVNRPIDDRQFQFKPEPGVRLVQKFTE